MDRGFLAYPPPMGTRSATEMVSSLFVRSRCTCGHLPTHHMVVQPLADSFNFRLAAQGPCAICGESVCKRFTASGA
jgi:hypothetical protein